MVVGSVNADLVFNVPRLPAAGETLDAKSMDTFPGGKVGGSAPHARLPCALSGLIQLSEATVYAPYQY